MRRRATRLHFVSYTPPRVHFPSTTPTRGFSSTPTCARTPKSAPTPKQTPTPRARSCARARVARHPVGWVVPRDTQSESAPSRAPSQRRNRREDDRHVPVRVIAHADQELAVAPRSSSITCDRGEKNVNANGTTQEERWAWSDGGWRSTDRGTLMRRACGLIVVNSTKRRARLIWPLRANALVSRHRYL